MFNSKIHDQIYYYLSILLAFFIPVHDKFVPPIIALIGLNWIFEFNFREKFRRILHDQNKRNTLAFGLLYMLYIIGVSYSEKLYAQEGALFDLEVKLSLLIFPLLFSTINFHSFDKTFFNRVLNFFVIGSLFSGLLIIGFSYYEFLNGTGDGSLFLYTSLSHWHHPSYLAMYFAFSIAILITRFLGNSKISKKEKCFYFFLIFCFQLLIVLLSSKAGILATAVMYLVGAVYLLLKRRLVATNHFWIPVLFLVSFFLTLLLFPQSYGRFVSIQSSIENQGSLPTDTHESSAARVLIWKSAFDVIKANPVFGVGTGDVKQELRKVYKERMISMALEEHLNAHNQYIQTTVSLGIIGLLILLLSLLLPAFLSIKRNSFLYLIFLVLVGFNFLVESMLERQAGVVFYAFFNVFLFYFAFQNKDIK